MGETAAYAVSQLNLAKAITYRSDRGHQVSNAILHCVFCNFRKDGTAEQRTEVFAALELLAKQLMASLGLILVRTAIFKTSPPILLMALLSGLSLSTH